MNFLIVINNEDYVSTVLNILKQVYKKIDNKILYISLSRPFKSLDMDFFREGIDKSKFIVIDCITKRIVPKIKNTSTCYFVKSPTAFDEVFDVIDYLFKEYKFDQVIFDSLSSLAIYSTELDAAKYVHDLLLKISLQGGCESSFMVVKSDMDSRIVTKNTTSFDKIIDVSKEE